eukprot:scaffold174432_cov30-Tisochrysis_lutea.AAC.2
MKWRRRGTILANAWMASESSRIDSKGRKRLAPRCKGTDGAQKQSKTTARYDVSEGATEAAKRQPALYTSRDLRSAYRHVASTDFIKRGDAARAEEETSCAELIQLTRHLKAIEHSMREVSIRKNKSCD